MIAAAADCTTNGAPMTVAKIKAAKNVFTTIPPKWDHNLQLVYERKARSSGAFG
jgi:hypothetical protein